jgi:hypothetical protein
MANWDSLPTEIHIEIFRTFCIDIIRRYEACFETLAPDPEKRIGSL